MSRRSGILLCVLALLGLTPRHALAAVYVPRQILVKYRPGLESRGRLAVESLGPIRTLHRFSLVPIDHVEIPEGQSVEEAIARLRRDPSVEYAEPNYEIHIDRTPNDPRFPEQYGLQNLGLNGGTAGADIHATQAWDVGTGNPGMPIGVLDTGIDYTHPDLAANLWTNDLERNGAIGVDDDDDGYIDDVHGYDFANNDGDPMDDNGHGTHVAGTIAAVGNNGIGVTGVCWGAKLVAIKFLRADGGGSADGAIAALQFAVTVGARLTNNSWSGASNSQALADAIIAAGQTGQLFISAAGNDGADIDVAPNFPSSFNSPYIMAVAATDARDHLASYSNYGVGTVDIAAPGDSILSTEVGGQYGLMSGTSMATPMVTGAAALVWSRFPSYSPIQVRGLLVRRADHVAALDGKVAGGLRLNALAIAGDADDSRPAPITDLAIAAPGSNRMGLTWSATGEDSLVGRAAAYDVRVSTSPITEANFSAARSAGGPDPLISGSPQTFEVTGLSISTRYYFAVKAFDAVGNRSPISNVVSGTTLAAPAISVAPGSFGTTLLTGGSKVQKLTITNTAGGTLDFSIPQPLVIASAGAAPQRAYTPLAKGEADLRVGNPVLAGTGGPDALGYRWSDSSQPGGPIFSWVDITTIGTLLPITGDDETSGRIALGIPFPFYGKTLDSARVCTNGFLTLADTVGRPFNNQPLPSPLGGISNMISPLWDDLDFAGTRRAYSYSDGNRFIVSWIDVPHLGSISGPYSFQVILERSGEIRFQYLRVPDVANSATVGIEDSTRTIGLTVAFNAPYLKNNLAIRFRRIPQWLSVSPTSGRVAAGASRDVEVRYDATGLATADVYGDITVQSNDPKRPTLRLPVHLRTIGAPDLAVSPAVLAFDSVQVNARPTRTLTLSNQGTGDLTVTNVTAGDPSLAVIGSTSFTLSAGASRDVTVRYAPTAVGVLDALVTIASNDPDAPSKTVRVTGRAIPAPLTAVSPESLVVTLAPNSAVSRTVRVSNQGTGDYVFTASVPVGHATTPPRNVPDVMPAPVPQIKGDAADRPGPRALRAGGPDHFGYTYSDSDEPGGPTFGWIDIRSAGTLLPMAGDDENTGPYPIGFPFPFYGAVFDSFRISTNGFISFTSILDAYTNTQLPNNQTSPPMPENLIAAFWDDLNFTPTPSAYYGLDGNRLVVQYQAVPRYGEPNNPNTFEIVLHSDGRIDYQYLDMRDNNISCTVGIQNATKDDGLTVAYDTPYVRDSLAVRILPPANVLGVNPTDGTIHPGDHVDLTALFNTAGLVGGTYRTAIQLEGNDPVRPTITIPCRVEVVGAPDLRTRPPALSFGPVFIGYPQSLDLEVQNLGTDVLSVTQIQSSDPAFTADTTAFSIEAFGHLTVHVRFAPTQVRSYPATLTLVSNDPDSSAYPVSVSGQGVAAPSAHVTPAQVPVALATTLGPTAQLELKPVVIQNTGGADLHWHAITSVTTLASALPEGVIGRGAGASAALDRVIDPAAGSGIEPPKDAPPARGHPTTEASGGPDAAGYRWLDSDDPGGPPFLWSDISTSGTRISFSRDDQNSGPIALPFPFPFYDGFFSSVRVCTNGWLSFTSNDSAYHNWPLPNTAQRAPGNLIAAYWDDLDFRTAGQALYAFDGQKFIISYLAAPHWRSPDVPAGTYTFQVLLYPSGQIDIQYQTMTGDLASATIGLQNETKTTGLQVAYNTAYVHDQLRVRFSRLPPWLSVLPDSGVVEPGGRDTLLLRCDATAVPDGNHESLVQIHTNDPQAAVIEVPVHLHVGSSIGVFALDPSHHAVSPPPERVAGRVTPPGCTPQSIVPSSVRVLRAVPVANGAPVTIQGCDGIFEFNRLALLSAIPGGAQVPVEVIGELDATQWFSALDTLRMLRPTLDRDPPPYAGGNAIQIIWSDAAGSPTSTYDLWFSPDSGATWSAITTGLSRHDYTWTVPHLATTRGFIELVANDLSAVFVGSTFSGPFEITGAPTTTEALPLPDRFGIALASANPAPRLARWTLSLPRRAPVDVRIYDVRGALVRRVAAREFEAGRHTLTWDGTDESGRSTGSGVYFVQARTAGQVARTRLVLVR